jgi:hypothetical protein
MFISLGKVKNAKERKSELERAKKQYPLGEWRFCPTHGVTPAFAKSQYNCVVCRRDLRLYCAYCEEAYDRHENGDHADCGANIAEEWKQDESLRGWLSSDSDSGEASLQEEDLATIHEVCKELFVKKRRRLSPGWIPPTEAGKLGLAIYQAGTVPTTTTTTTTSDVIDMTSFQKRKLCDGRVQNLFTPDGAELVKLQARLEKY